MNSRTAGDNGRGRNRILFRRTSIVVLIARLYGRVGRFDQGTSGVGTRS